MLAAEPVEEAGHAFPEPLRALPFLRFVPLVLAGVKHRALLAVAVASGFEFLPQLHALLRLPGPGLRHAPLHAFRLPVADLLADLLDA